MADEKIRKDDISVEERDVDSKVPYVSEDEEFVRNYPEEKRRKTIWKLDIRLIPLLLLLYLMSYLDRANLGNAKVEGLEDSLGMTGNDYQVASSVFFVPYIVLDIPSNYVLKKYFSERPSYWIGFLTVSWGIVMTLTGIVKDFGGLCAARIMLGAAEAGFFPGAVLLTSYWYVKNEMQLRVAIFYLASSLSGAFSGLLAFAIAKMDGIAGLEGWRWIFILEGILTVLMGIITFFCLPDSPEKSNSWLDEDEIRYLRERMTLQDGGKGVVQQSEFSWNMMKQVLLDFKLYLGILIYWAASGPTYGMKFNLPQIVTQMGYTSSEAQLLSMPPYIAGGISGVIFSWLADKNEWRMPFIASPILIEVVGFAMLTGLAPKLENNIAACYFAVCLVNIGIYPINPGISSWTSNNLAGAEKRSLGLGYYMTFGSVGGIIGSFMFKDNEAPDYPTGYGLGLALCVAGALSCFILEYYLWFKNKKNAQMTVDEVKAMYTDEQLADMGDWSPLYKYTL